MLKHIWICSKITLTNAPLYLCTFLLSNIMCHIMMSNSVHFYSLYVSQNIELSGALGLKCTSSWNLYSALMC